MTFASIEDNNALLKDSSATCEELVKQSIAQIDKQNEHVNAIVLDLREEAIGSAKKLDQHIQRDGFIGPLHGIPVTVKESFNMAGYRTTVNFPRLKNNIANEDSIIVKRLKEAGAVIVGKTNVPTLLADSQTYGPLFPTANNPYDHTRVPGGSTGGGAAAVASGMCTFEIGSDIGGSIRNPAHYCGLFGLKPTQNGHNQDGHVPPMPFRKSGFSAMNSTGPLARTIGDLRLAYETCYAPRWDYLRYLPINPELTHQSVLGAYKVAYFDEIHGVSCNDDTKRAIDKVVQKLKDSGAKVEKISLDKKLIHRIFQVWAGLFGFVVGQDNNWLVRQLLKLKFGKDMKGAKLNLSKELNQGLNMKFKAYTGVLAEQQECIAEFSRLFDDFDFILSPTSVGPAFKHNHNHRPITTEGKEYHYADYCFSFVMPYNSMGNPVLTIPTGLGNEGLPIGISVAGPHYSENALLHFGKLLEAEGFKFSPPA